MKKIEKSNYWQRSMCEYYFGELYKFIGGYLEFTVGTISLGV